MADFQTLYLKSCKATSMSPNPCITEACQRKLPVLDLSNNCLTHEHCSVIGKCLQSCHHFTDLNFSDCMMGDMGLLNVFHHLKSDCQLSSIVLKGNNICGKGAKLIGKILKSSSSLERLSLEWNNVGANEEGFRELCEGLALNTSLQYLDLRSNNIDHNGAIQLASALVSNYSLLEVDLRWNTIGVIGGRALLSALARNHTLLTLSVEGSNVPKDMVEAIGNTISLRFSKHVSDLHHKAEALQLSEQLKRLQVDKKHQIGGLLKKLDTERSLFLETTQLSQYEMAELKAKLEENDVSLLTLEQRLESSQNALQQSLSECEKLRGSKEKLQTEMDTKESHFMDEIASLKRELSALQDKHAHCMQSGSTNESNLKQQISAITSEKEQLKDRAGELSDALESIKREHAHELSSLQNHCLQIKEQHTQHLKQLHDTHKKELLVHMKRYDEHQAECHKRILNYDEKVLKLEQEVSSLSQKLIVVSRQATEEAHQSGHSLRTQEIQNKSLRDHVDAVEKAAREDKDKMKEMQLCLARVQDEISTKELQIKESKLKIQELTKQLECNNLEHRVSKKSHQEEMEKLNTQCRTVNEDLARLKQEHSDLKQEHHRMELCHKKEVSSLVSEKEDLQKSVDHYKHLLHKLRDEEAHRTLMLTTALQSYLSTSPKFDVN